MRPWNALAPMGRRGQLPAGGGGDLAGTENSVQSVVRAMDVLEAVAAAGEMGVTELARALGLHVATVHNLLRTLTARHYLLNAGGRYRLGPAMAVLASRWDPLRALPERLQPYLERISRESGEAASATVLVGYEARLVAFQAGTEAITIHFPQWSWPQALKLATGRLLVALGEPTQWPEFVARSPDVVPGATPAQWQAELLRLREQGYCALRTDRDGGQALVAYPLRTRGGTAIASIGAACPLFRATPERCAAMAGAVWRAAAELSREMGGEAPPPPHVAWEALSLEHQVNEAPVPVFGAFGEGDHP